MCHCHNQSHSCCGSSHASCGCQSKGCSCSCHQSQNDCQKSCGCEGSNQSKGCGCGCKSCGNYAEKFLQLADQAWTELLKEKIKEHIQSQAKNMNDLARLISEANHERWQKKMENAQCCGCYEEKLKEFFSHPCQVHPKSDNAQQKNQSNKPK